MVAYRTVQGKLDAKGLKVSVIASRFNDFITDRLIDGAVDCLVRHGAQEDQITVYRVPGSFELPLAAKKVVSAGNVDAVICLGALIRGQTPHFDFIASEVTKGIAQISLDSGVPVTSISSGNSDPPNGNTAQWSRESPSDPLRSGYQPR